MFKIHLADINACVPIRSELGAAGYDLTSVEQKVVSAKSQCVVDTGVVLEFPSDCYARIAPRSGLAAKNSIDVMAGVIDSTYRGNIKVILFNHGANDFVINVGDRIAQLIFERIYTPELQKVDSLSQLSNTVRGDGGFGSTGV